MIGAYGTAVRRAVLNAFPPAGMAAVVRIFAFVHALFAKCVLGQYLGRTNESPGAELKKLHNEPTSKRRRTARRYTRGSKVTKRRRDYMHDRLERVSQTDRRQLGE